MKIRVSVLFMLLVSFFALISMRTYNIGVESLEAALQSGTKTIDIAQIRGTVYDCKLRPITNAEFEYTAAAKPTQKAVAVLKKMLAYDAFKAVSERMLSGNPIAIKINARQNDCTDITVVEYPKRYSSYLACHLIGYLDSSGQGISGAEKAFNATLDSYSYTVGARFRTDAYGRVLLGEDIELVSNANKGGVALTIDREIQKITEKALDNSNINRGAAVVIDIESGAIVASVSRPAFAPDNIAESLENSDSPLINRAFLPFTVGSVFKPVVAAAAIEKGIEDYEYECTGSVMLNGVTFNCHKEDGHGKVDMRDAMAYSCNTYFISLALKTGAESIIKTAEDFGFGQETVFAPSLKSSQGNLPSLDELDSAAAIANIAFGQGALTATPLQICSATAAIARNGVFIKPWLILGEVNQDGEIINQVYSEQKKRIIGEKTARIISGFLKTVVEKGSGKRAVSDIVTVSGKTATAQTGQNQNGEEIYNAWFSGFFPSEAPKYAITVLKENGGEGALSCAPVFKDIAEGITNYEAVK